MEQGLKEIIAAQKLGIPRGIFSVCSAHPTVLETAVQFAKARDSLLLVESTCNQVNQYGGYAGLTPQAFAAEMQHMAAQAGLNPRQLILGGDHLGPSVWQKEHSTDAMAKANLLVHDCVLAGYTKIHLDTSMKLGDDDPHSPLALEVSGERTAALCKVAEKAFTQLPAGSPPLVYVIGSEVPLPGGAQVDNAEIQVTHAEDALATIECMQHAFRQQGLESAWERVIALVVQPGVEFGEISLHRYNRALTVDLTRLIATQPGLVYEAHSTDYQTRIALRQMVEDHFAILKVGPALTFAYREAVFALAAMEQEWLGTRELELSGLPDILEGVMLENPNYWQKYYHGDEAARRFARKYSFSDRVRYYWPEPLVRQTLDRLLANLSHHPVPLPLLSQYLPGPYEKVRSGELENMPAAWIREQITAVLKDYAYACG